MSTNYRKGQLVFYIDGDKRTLAFVNDVFFERKELEIYYLDDNYDILKKTVRSDKIREAIRDSGISDVMDEKYLENIQHVRKVLITLSDFNINKFKDLQGGTHKSKRHKSRHHKKTNRRRKSNRRKSQRNKK